MGLEIPYTARDISINPMGRMEILDGPPQLDQAIYRFFLNGFRKAVGVKQPAASMDVFIRALVIQLSQDFVAMQQSAPNYNLYTGNELVDRIDLSSYDVSQPGVFIAKLKVFLQSGATLDVNTAAPGGTLQ